MGDELYTIRVQTYSMIKLATFQAAIKYTATIVEAVDVSRATNSGASILHKRSILRNVAFKAINKTVQV